MVVQQAHSFAKKAGLKEFFESSVKIAAKIFPFPKKFVSLKKGKIFASGSASFEISVIKSPLLRQYFSRYTTFYKNRLKQMKPSNNNSINANYGNQTMEFTFSNKRLYQNLVFGILWLGIGISYFFEQDAKWKYKPYFILAVGVLYIILFVFEFKSKYFKITSDRIIINSIPSKQIDLRELTEVKYFSNDYTFKTANKNLKIVKSQINQKQLPKFEYFFDNLKSSLKKNVV